MARRRPQPEGLGRQGPPPAPLGFAVEPLSRAQFHFYHRSDRDLHLLSQADTLDPIGGRIADLVRLAHAEAALELIDRLVWGEEPHRELYDLLAATLESVSRAPATALPPLTIAFPLPG